MLIHKKTSGMPVKLELIRNALTAFTLVVREYHEEEEKKEQKKAEAVSSAFFSKLELGGMRMENVDKMSKEQKQKLAAPTKSDNLILPKSDKDGEVSFANIHKALRLINMSISENLFKTWFKHVDSNL
jgi:hypothetical protein